MKNKHKPTAADSAHTPAPWVDGVAGQILGPGYIWPNEGGRADAVIVATVSHGDGGSYQNYPTKIARANKRLIVAAPDLLAECRYALAALRGNANPKAAIRGLVSVLARADGRRCRF